MNQSNLAVRAPLPASGLSVVGQAFKRALVSQCHPNMLLALFLPFLIALLVAIILLWAFWEPLTSWLNLQASEWGFIIHVDQWLLAVGLFSIRLTLLTLVAVVFFFLISGI